MHTERVATVLFFADADDVWLTSVLALHYVQQKDFVAALHRECAMADLMTRCKVRARGATSTSSRVRTVDSEVAHHLQRAAVEHMLLA